MIAALVLAAACGAAFSPPIEPVTVIHAGTLLAAPGEPPLAKQTIVVEGKRIAAVDDGFQPASRYGEQAKLVDLSDRFVMPGLTDLHMHLAIFMDAEKDTPDAKLALMAAGHVRKLLYAGVTTVRDMGDNSGVTIPLRDAIANGTVEGPRLFVAGPIVSRTGGHGVKQAACDGADACRRVVRENVSRGSDWIKVTVSGSGRDKSGEADAEPILFPDEVEAVTSAARQSSRPVAAHAHSTAAIRLALQHGAKTIEHGTYFDESSVPLFKDAYLIPTAFVAEFVASKLAMFQAGGDLKRWTESAMANPGRAYRAGIRLGVGSDAGGGFDPTATAHEIALFVRSGVPPSEALKAATVNAAAILGMERELGRIAPGFLADFIAMKGDPLQDVGRLKHVDFVMKDGVPAPSLH